MREIGVWRRRTGQLVLLTAPLWLLLLLTPPPAAAATQRIAVGYSAWNGAERQAIVVVPADYDPAVDGALPVVISPHPRGWPPTMVASRWGDLPGEHRFAVICADSAGVRNPYRSWGASGQVSDLMRMPAIAAAGVPGLELDSDRVYVVGCSMGGQEALVVLARYPDRIAAAVCLDGVTDLARRYYELPYSRNCSGVQEALAHEVGGTPRTARQAYARRSPLSYVRSVSSCGVPLELYWNPADAIVIHQATTQSGTYYRRLLELAPLTMPVAHITNLPHAGAFSFRTYLPAVVDFLCPTGVWRSRRAIPPARWCYRSWRGRASVWGYSFAADPLKGKSWSVTGVNNGGFTASSPAKLRVSVPWSMPGNVAATIGSRHLELSPDEGYIVLRLPAGTTRVTLAPITY